MTATTTAAANTAATNTTNTIATPCQAPTIFGQIMQEQFLAMKAIKSNLVTNFDADLNSTLKFRRALDARMSNRERILRKTKAKLLDRCAKKNIELANAKLSKTIAKTFYVKFRVKRHATWMITCNNLKSGAAFEPGHFIAMLIKSETAKATPYQHVDSEEQGLMHAALVARNQAVKEFILAPFKGMYMKKDISFTAPVMLQLVIGVNKCAYALNNISHLSNYDSCAILFNVARKQGIEFEEFVHQMTNFECHTNKSLAIATSCIPVLAKVHETYTVYNKKKLLESSNPMNILFYDFARVHKSLVCECMLWRFVFTNNVCNFNISNAYRQNYELDNPPPNLCQSFPGIFSVLAHVLWDIDYKKFKLVQYTLFRIHNNESPDMEKDINFAADAFIELLYRLHDYNEVVATENTFVGFERCRYKAYLDDIDFLTNNIVSST